MIRKTKRPKMKLMAGNVLINPKLKENVTPSGIILLDNSTAKANIDTGVVVDIARPLPGIPVQFICGAIVAYGSGTGTSIEVDGIDMIIMKHNEVIAVM